MKLLIATLLLFLIFPSSVLAHGTGLPPFFYINGKLAPSYPLSVARLLPSLLNLPQDISPENYSPNQKLNFLVSTSDLSSVISPDILGQTDFSWDLGDGTNATGLTVFHSYSKIGSYTLSIIANYHQSGVSNQLVESVIINIVPQNYVLPKAVLSVNKSAITDPTGIKDIDLGNSLNFDGSSSTGNITEYAWDLDDGSPIFYTKSLDHQYQLPLYFVEPVLRVKDNNGFISYTSVNLRNSGDNKLKQGIPKQLIGIASGVFLIATLIGFKRRKK